MSAVVRRMLVLILVPMVALGVAGCAASDDGADIAPEPDAGSGEVAVPDDTVDADETDDGVPEADPALDAEDLSGRTPTDAFNEHIAAVGTGDPEAVWSTYGCSPPTDFETWAFEWEDAAEVYSDVRVLEERVVASTLAYVRVVYRVTSGDDEVIVEEPGEWWRIEQVEGAWKVGWLPRQ